MELTEDQKAQNVKSTIDRIYKDFKPVLTRLFDSGVSVSIRSEVDMPEVEAQRLAENANRAVLLTQQINDGQMPHDGKLPLYIHNTYSCLMSFNNANKDLLQLDSDSQTAAILHEEIEGLQEDMVGSRTINF